MRTTSPRHTLRQGYYLAVTGDERLALQAYTASAQAARQAGNVEVQADVLALQVVSLTHLGELEQAASLMQAVLALLPQSRMTSSGRGR